MFKITKKINWTSKKWIKQSFFFVNGLNSTNVNKGGGALIDYLSNPSGSVRYASLSESRCKFFQFGYILNW